MPKTAAFAMFTLIHLYEARVREVVKFTYRSKNARRYNRHKTGTTWMSIFLMTLLSLTFGNISFAVLIWRLVFFVSNSSWTDKRPPGESEDNPDD